MSDHSPASGNDRPERRRLRTARRWAGFSGAAFLTPYLLIKISWVVGAVLGWLPIGRGFSLAGWLTLNIVTIVMAATGIALALTLGLGGPARRPAVAKAVAGFAWIATGFLVPLLPYLAISSVLPGSDPGPQVQQGQASGGQSELPGWEAALIQVSFAGLALALAVAVPLYVIQHGSGAFTGRLGDRPAVPHPAAVPAFVGAALVAVTSGHWAAGGRLGLARPAAADLQWRLQSGTSAAWALAGAGCVWMLTRRRPASAPLWLPLAIAWATSGYLVAWNVWRLPFIVVLSVNGFPDGVVWPEDLLVAGGLCLLSILAGTAMLVTLLRAYAQPQRPGVSE